GEQRVLGMDSRRRWHNRRIQSGSVSRLVGRNAGSRCYDGGVELESATRLIASEISLRRSNHVRRKAGSRESRVQALGWRRPGIGLEGEQVGDCLARKRKLKVGSVDDLLRPRGAASYVNGLSPVVGFLTSGAACGSGLGAPEILSARKFVARVVNDFVGLQLGRCIGAELVDLPGKDHDHKYQERLQQKRTQHAPVGKNTVWSFPGEARAGAGKGWTDGSDEPI